MMSCDDVMKIDYSVDWERERETEREREREKREREREVNSTQMVGTGRRTAERGRTHKKNHRSNEERHM